MIMPSWAIAASCSSVWNDCQRGNQTMTHHQWITIPLLVVGLLMTGCGRGHTRAIVKNSFWGARHLVEQRCQDGMRSTLDPVRQKRGPWCRFRTAFAHRSQGEPLDRIFYGVCPVVEAASSPSKKSPFPTCGKWPHWLKCWRRRVYCQREGQRQLKNNSLHYSYNFLRRDTLMQKMMVA